MFDSTALTSKVEIVYIVISFKYVALLRPSFCGIIKVFKMADMMISEDVKSLPAAEVRQLPCTVHFSGKANVIQRFDTYMEEASDGDKKLVKAYFRGYPLVGTRIPVPEGYK